MATLLLLATLAAPHPAMDMHAAAMTQCQQQHSRAVWRGALGGASLANAVIWAVAVGVDEWHMAGKEAQRMQVHKVNRNFAFMAAASAAAAWYLIDDAADTPQCAGG